MMCPKHAERIDPDQSDIGLHCLPTPVYPNTCTVMILSFRTDMPGQTVQTQIRLLLIRVYTVCHSVCIVWTHSTVEPHSSNFIVNTTNFLGVRIFRKITVCNVFPKTKTMATYRGPSKNIVKFL